MYVTPRVERFGSLGALTLFKPEVGLDLAQPDQNQCTFPSEGGGGPPDPDNSECLGGGGGRS